MKKIMICGATALMLIACGSENNFDATGTFEATEVVISSEVAGRIVEFDVQEGDMVTADAAIGLIDTMQSICSANNSLRSSRHYSAAVPIFRLRFRLSESRLQSGRQSAPEYQICLKMEPRLPNNLMILMRS